MHNRAIKIEPDDDLIVALVDLAAGTSVPCGGRSYVLREDVPAKHKFTARDLAAGQTVRMYGVVVGRTRHTILTGQRITVENLADAVQQPRLDRYGRSWQRPDVSRWAECTFLGYRREDGRVGTANYWIVAPLVFCENRNVLVLRDALREELGYGRPHRYRPWVRRLIQAWRDGQRLDQIPPIQAEPKRAAPSGQRVFPHVDGIKFLPHGSGCGETYADTDTFCELLAQYITHPNVAGATVLSLGCQKAQIQRLEEAIHRWAPRFNRPLYVFEQQRLGTESTLLEQAIRGTLAGLAQADGARREPVPLSHLVLGTECGGSDGLSGLTANPAIGHCADLLVALGGSVILSEFPELSSVQQDLIERCQRQESAQRFLELMRRYEARLAASGTGFHSNPSPGNIADGLVTEAMKAAGAARKGGTSPVVDVLDYPEPVRRPGLNLLCTPGGDVESTTALAGSGATVIAFSTGLGTPTGNPVTPVLKIASNSTLARTMPDIIDLDAGPILSGQATVEGVGQQLLELVIRTASGHYQPKAVLLEQDDFMPWKRDVSL
ncbi:MAG TPA: altronate dehydratase [Planctomycetes bacterium]|nr:altronate dehydratase [Planctomycetota bacterium]